MTPLAHEPSGQLAGGGRVRNSWNLDSICGGSLSGSAAAVAAGMDFVAFGSDRGGSIRIPAPCIAPCEPESGSFNPRTLYELSALTRVANYFGVPAVSFPAGFDGDELPIAVQIVGWPGTDEDLLALAERLLESTEFRGRVPSAFADGLSFLCEVI